MKIRSDIPQNRLSELEFNCDISEHFIECMIFKLKIRNEIWYIIYAYKHPTVSNSSLLIMLKSVYDKLLNKEKSKYLLGDLNIDMMQDENILGEVLCCVYNLDNIISQSTCFKKPEDTLEDPILVRNAKRFKRSINVYCGYSVWNHMVGCITKLHVPPPKPVKLTYRNCKNFDQSTFKAFPYLYNTTIYTFS